MANDLLIELSVRDKGAKDQIKALNKEMRELNKVYKVSGDTLKKQGDSFKTLQAQQEHYSNKLKLVNAKIKVCNDELKKLEGSYKKQGETLNKSKRELEKYNNKVESNKNILKLAIRENNNLDDSNKKLGSSYKKINSELKNNETKYASLNSKIQEHRNKIKELRSDKKRNNSLIKEEQSLLNSTVKDRRKLSQVMNTQKQSLSNINVAMEKNNETIKQNKFVIADMTNQLKANRDKQDEFKKSIIDTQNAMDSNRKTVKYYKDNLTLATEQRKNLTASEKEAQRIYEKSQLEKEIQRLKDYSKQMDLTVQKHRLIGEVSNNAGNAILKATAPLVAFGAYGLKSAVDFESAFAGVRKTVDATEEQFSGLRKTILGMSEHLPQSASDIAKVMEIAGQLGIKVKDLDKFTETMIKLGDSTNVTSENAALLLAQFTNITGMDTKDIDRLASVIVDLGNNSATTEDKIINMLQSIAGGASVYGLSEHEMAGLATTMSALGIESEKGGTAITKFMFKILSASGKSSEEFKAMGEKLGLTAEEIENSMQEAGKAMENFSTVTGLTADEFRNLIKENPSEALTLLIDGLGKMNDEGKDILPVLEAMGIKEVRLRDTILRLAKGHKQLRDNMKLSKKAWEDNTALTVESNKRYETTESKLKMLQNSFKNVAMEIGVQLLPEVIKLMEKGKELVAWFKGLDDSTKQNIISFTKLAVATGLTLKGVGKVSSVFANVIDVGNRFRQLKISKLMLETGEGAIKASKGVGLVSGALGSAGTSSGLLASGFSLLNPVTLTVAAGMGALYTGLKLVDAQQKLNNKTILDTKENMTAWEEVVAFFNGTQTKTSAELEKLGLKYSDTSKLSKEFASNVESSRVQLADFNYYLEKISLDKVFKIEDMDTLDEKLNEIISGAKKVLDDSKTDIQQKFQEMFSLDGKLDETEQKTIEFLTKNKDKQIEIVNQLEKEIQAIKKKAVDEKRDLNEQEVRDIEAKVKEIKRLELESLAKTQEDRLYMINKFDAEIGNLNAEGVSEKLQAQKKANDELIANTKATFDTQIELLKQKISTLNGEEKLQAEESLRILERKKAETLKMQKDEYNDLIKLIKKKYPEIAKEIDAETGKILTNEDKSLNKSFESWKGHYKKLEDITHSGYTLIENKTTGAMERVYVKVDETTGKMVGVYNVATKEIVASTEQQKKELEELGNSSKTLEQRISADFVNIATSTKDGTKLSGSHLRYLKKEMGFVEDESGNLKGKIVDLNGTPVEVKISKDGTIQDLENILKKLNKIPTYKDVLINVKYNGGNAPGVYSRNRSFASNVFASGTNYLKPYASGINNLPRYASGGHVRTRVNEMGFELFDFPKNTRGYMLGTHRGDDIMDLPVGTKITNHIASTKLMIEAVKREVAKQLNPILNARIESKDTGERSLKQEITVKFENVVIKDERDIKDIINQMKYEIMKEVQ